MPGIISWCPSCFFGAVADSIPQWVWNPRPEVTIMSRDVMCQTEVLLNCNALSLASRLLIRASYKYVSVLCVRLWKIFVVIRKERKNHEVLSDFTDQLHLGMVRATSMRQYLRLWLCMVQQSRLKDEVCILHRKVEEDKVETALRNLVVGAAERSRSQSPMLRRHRESVPEMLPPPPPPRLPTPPPPLLRRQSRDCMEHEYILHGIGKLMLSIWLEQLLRKIASPSCGLD